MLTEENFRKLAKLEDFASRRGRKVGELALAWLLAKPWVSTIIAGARSIEQVKANLGAVGWKLTAEEVSELDAI